jgi:mannose-6-phosphate isomerase-like protein (cupin superfamily)
MQAFDLTTLLARLQQTERAYLEFLRVPALSLGVYRLQVGQSDRQQPHTEDEVYYVVAGKAKFRAAGEVRAVAPGDVLFVKRLEEHRFFDILEDLTTLVFFAPAEGTSSATETPPAH